MNNQISMLDMVDRYHEQQIREKLKGWERPKFKEPAGLVVICEQKLFRDGAYKNHFYRAVLGYHRTVGGMEAHLVHQPNEEWPDRAPWGTGLPPLRVQWIYPSGSMMHFYTNGETADPIWDETEVIT